MNPSLSSLGYPIGAGMTRGEKRWEEISELMNEVPKAVRNMIASPYTASSIRGLVKTYMLPPEKRQVIAYAVLQVALGEKTIAQLSSILSTEIPLPNDKAQNMAKELEEDLLAPIMPEIAKYLKRKNSGINVAPKGTTSSNPPLGVNNVLNLKDQKRISAPPPMPKSNEQ